jgi:DnaJ-class molecular chaperone
MIIKTQFNIGDVLVTINTDPIKTNCNTCQGTGKIKLNSKEFCCPECHGVGCDWDYKNFIYSVGQAMRVDYIDVRANKDGSIEEFYKHDTGDSDRDYEMITVPHFISFTEAESYCKKQNAKSVKK